MVKLTPADKILEDRCILSVLKGEASTVTLPPVDLSLTRASPLTVSKVEAVKLVML